MVVAAIAVLLQAYLGLRVALRPPPAERLKRYERAFMAIGAIGFVAVVWGGVRTIEYQAKLDAGVTYIEAGQDALPNRVLVVMAKLLGVPNATGKYPETVIGSISSKIQELQDRQVIAPTIIRGGRPFFAPRTSGILDINTVPGSKTAIWLPAKPFKGEYFDIKDGAGNAGTGTIIVYGNGYPIDGVKEYPLPYGRQAIRVTFDGKQWLVT